MRLTHVSKSFDGRPVLINVTHTFKERAVTAVSGPSGSGKTTLANILLGLVIPDAGRVEGFEKLCAAAVFQEDRLIEHYTARDNLLIAAPRGTTPGEVDALLSEMGLQADAMKRVQAFSGGMKRRVAIARALIVKPDLLVLDEPFKGLDEAARSRVIRSIKGRSGDSAIVLITHDSDELLEMGVSDQIVLAPTAHGWADTRHTESD